MGHDTDRLNVLDTKPLPAINDGSPRRSCFLSTGGIIETTNPKS
jgi:hypothetical protein